MRGPLGTESECKKLRWSSLPARNCALGRDDIEFADTHYIFINAWRSILPVPVFGNSAMNRISRGYL